MKKINFKKPKYIIPLIIIIPILFIGYQVCSMMSFTKEEDKSVITEDVNTDLPTVNTEKTKIKSKYQSMLDNFGKVTDYTGVDNIEREEEIKEKLSSSYNEEQKRLIDSLNAVREEEEKRMKELIRQNQQNTERRVNVSSDRLSNNREMDELTKQMQMIQKMANGEQILTEEEKEAEQRRRELAKMRKEIADSIAALNAPTEVQKAGRANEQYFNTVADGENNNALIRGRVDEMVKVKDGSRLRIRLSDDVEIEGQIIPKGTYVYANVTGFSAQRVKAKVKSMMVGGKITNVDLSVYDLDCQEGFFVPSSAFRELAKDIGAGAMNMNVNMNSTGEQSLESVAMQSLQQAFQATTSAIAGNIRQNKAKIKYNTEIYLISNK